MNLEMLFSIAGILAMLGWLMLLASPFAPNWSQRIAGVLIPILLSLGYLVLFLTATHSEGGGFGSLAEVGALFAQPQVLLAGWVHFLAFDLLIGAWICKTARDEQVKFWFIIPCLLLTFLFGPIGFLAFSILRLVSRGKESPADAAV